MYKWFPRVSIIFRGDMWKTRENWQQNQFRLAPGCFQPEPNLGIHYHSATTTIYIYIYIYIYLFNKYRKIKHCQKSSLHRF